MIDAVTSGCIYFDLRIDSCTDSTLRPRALRRFNTLRPPGVRIRSRKPCVFNRFRTLGCHVLFGMFHLRQLWSLRPIEIKDRLVNP